MERVLDALTALADFVLLIDAGDRCRAVAPSPMIPGVLADALPDSGDVEGQPVDALFCPPLAELLDKGIREARSSRRSRQVFRLSEPDRTLSIDFGCGGDREVVILGRLALGRGSAASEAPAELDRVLSRLPQGVLLQGPKAEILTSNPAALELLGLTEAQLLGRSSFDPSWRLIHMDGSPMSQDQAPVPVALRERRPVTGASLGVERGSHDLVWLSVDAVPELDAQGEVVDVVCSFQDVTQQVEAKAALEREHDLLSKVMVASVAGIAVLDSSGHIVYANRAAEAILGLSRSELEERRYDDPKWRSTDIDGGDWPDERQPFVRVMQTKAPVFDVRHGIEWPDGSRKLLSINGAPLLDAQGEVDRLVFAIVDVTAETEASRERQRVREHLEQLTRLESLTMLAGGVAHDFNNLLVSIMGGAALARDEVGTDHPAATSLELIETAGERARDLTRQLLAYSGSAQLPMGAVDLRALLQDQLELLQALVGRSVVLSADLPTEPLIVNGEKSQLTQIVMNLILNAGQAMLKNGGQVTLSLTERELQAAALDEAAAGSGDARPGRFALLTVRDNGPGISKEDRERVFVPFFSTKTEQTNRGLGLSAVLGITRSHGGCIFLRSQVGVGTEFVIALPLSLETSAPVAPTPAFAPTPGRGQRVMVIEDEDVVARFISRVLERHGFVASVFTNGREAIDRLEGSEGPPELVVLDRTMPELSGDEVLKRIRGRLPELPVILTSGYADTALPEDDSRLAFLAKPFRPRDLLAAIERVRR